MSYFRGGAVFFLAVLGLIGGCAPSNRSPHDSSEQLTVLATVAPMAWLVEQIGGERVTAEVLVPAGKEPETFAPTPSDLTRLARGTIFFRVGLASEAPLVPRLSGLNRKMEIVDLRDGLDLLALTEHNHDGEHDHGDAGHNHADNEHDHGADSSDCGLDGLDPHLWMSPALVGQMGEKIAAVLSAKDPSGAAEYQKNLENFLPRLAEATVTISDSLAEAKSRTIYVFHPAYGYFCREFRLEQVAIESGGKAPKPRELAEWIRRVSDEQITTVIAQPEFNRSAIQAISEAAPVHIVVHSPLEPNLFDNWSHLTDIIAKKNSINQAK